jgi:hypothetical protein
MPKYDGRLSDTSQVKIGGFLEKEARIIKHGGVQIKHFLDKV